MLEKVKHPNIVNLIHGVEQAQWNRKSSKLVHSFIALELVPGGELFDYISESGGLNDKICRFYFKQMLAALHCMHSQGITHRDLKPENILIDENYNIKIADFGFAAPVAGRDG